VKMVRRLKIRDFMVSSFTRFSTKKS